MTAPAWDQCPCTACPPGPAPCPASPLHSWEIPQKLGWLSLLSPACSVPGRLLLLLHQQLVRCFLLAAPDPLTLLLPAFPIWLDHAWEQHADAALHLMVCPGPECQFPSSHQKRRDCLLPLGSNAGTLALWSVSASGTCASSTPVHHLTLASWPSLWQAPAGVRYGR